MNTDAPWPTPDEATARVLEIQTRLHRWASDDPRRRFGDLYNLVHDPAVLQAAWDRVRKNRGARTAGVDGQTVRSIGQGHGSVEFLEQLRADLKARTFEPLPVRERRIPKTGGKLRRLGIPTVRDRVVQAALKVVLEPVFEADFQSCSYGFRPNRRAQDAIAEIHHYCTNSYEWVLEGDITACFDEIDHTALMSRISGRVSDKKVLALVKAFLKSGLLSEDGIDRDTWTGTPQGGILSPLLANIALSGLDDHFAEAWALFGKNQQARSYRRSKGLSTYRLVRYADDFVVLVAGTREHAEQQRAGVAAVLSEVGLRLNEEKTGVVHIDEGFDFLGFRIRRDRKRGSGKAYIYTYPSKRSVASIKRKIKAVTRQTTSQSLEHLLCQLNPVLRGWTAYFRHGVSAATYAYLRHYTWRRVVVWLRHKHPRANWKQMRRQYLDAGWWPSEGKVVLFNPAAVRITRYRYRGTRIPTPWMQQMTPDTPTDSWRAGCVETRTSGSEARAGETD
ncbi:MAG: group II intron reverse transcriptase/maturase [Actinomycetota bacterium]